jgi:hypothetical protein
VSDVLRRRLTTKQREELYASEVQKAQSAGRGDFPICRLCDRPIVAGSLWDENHQGHKPAWLGGVTDGISHRRCNRINNNEYATPLFAKSERVRKGWLDLRRSRTPLPGGRDDRLKKKIDGRVVERAPE